MIAQTSCADLETARALAQSLVKRRLAACVSISAPVESVYPWQGTIEQTEERVLTIKTAPQRLAALQAHIAEAHPYAVPELLAWPVTDGATNYLNWATEWLVGDPDA
jgi:periplasmic divalent cation tolerance protein